VEKLLRGFDELAFVIGHSLTQTIPHRRPPEDGDSTCNRQKPAEVVLAYASRRRKGKSTNRKFGVSSQLSPLESGNWRRSHGERELHRCTVARRSTLALRADPAEGRFTAR